MTSFKNTLNYICLGAALMLHPGCKKVLEENPRSILTPANIATPAGIEAIMSGAYSNMRYFWGTEGFAYSSNAGTDEVIKGRDGTDSWFTYQNILPSDGTVSALWSLNYQTINNLNGVIDNADRAGIDPKIKAIRVGEARFLRALCYFQLVQIFGDVPLNLSFNTVATTSASRNPVAEVYPAIIRDLEEAIKVLPDKPNNPTPGRASKAAAYHLLAKVYLTKGWSSVGQTSDFTNARTTAETLLNNKNLYGLDLWPDFADVFKEGNEYGRESIFVIERNTNAVASESGYNNSGQQDKENRSNYFWRPLYTDNVPNATDTAVLATMETTTNGTTFTRNALMVRDVVNGRPFLRFRPTDYTLNVAFADKINDSRYDNTFQKAWIYNMNNPNMATRRGKLVQGVDTAIYMPAREVTIEERRAFKGVIVAPSQYNAVWFPSMKKHDDQTRLHFNDPSDRPLIIMRLGETYLIAAEAAYKEGNPDLAAQYLNVLRQRASFRAGNSAMQNSTSANALNISSSQVTIDFILDEYTRERYGEYTRWYDLVRTKSLIERVKKYNPVGGPNIQPHHVLRPVPQEQIDRTTTGPAFPQNPGY